MQVTTSNPQWTIRTLLIWLVLVCLLPGIIGAAIFVTYGYYEGRSKLGKSIIQTTRALVQTVDGHLLRTQAIAQTLSTADTLVHRDFARFYKSAQAAAALAGFESSVVLIDHTGQQILNTSVPFGHRLPHQDIPSCVRHVFSTGMAITSDLFISPRFNRPMISVGVPVVIDGKIAYVLAINIRAEHFTEILRTQSLPAGWVAGVFDSAGIIVGRTRTPERFTGHTITTELLQSMKTAPEGWIKAVSKEGIPVLTSYSLSPVTKWGVGIGVPREIIRGLLVQSLLLLAGGVAILFCVGLVLAWFMGGRIASSVKALTNPAMALGNGKSAPIPPVYIKEVAEVAQAIGQASDLLNERAAILQAKEAELREAHKLAKFGNWWWNLLTGEVWASDSIRHIYGREVPSFPEQRGTLLSIESWERVNAASQDARQFGKGYDLELEVNHGDGHIIWINAKCEAVRNEKGDVTILRGTVQDITEQKRVERRIREAALHDSLTGLPNRAFVFEFCNHLLAAARRNHSSGALLFIDIDRFKPINDLYGHEIGDRVLYEIGRRLVQCTRPEDLVGRLGGDEFVIVLPYISTDHHRAAIVARHIIDNISKPFQIDTLEVSISTSIGISFFPQHATDVGALIHTADLAMYQAKRSGRANYQYYTPELYKRANKASAVEAKLNNALKHGGLRLHYQPVIDINSGKVIGAEALARLTDNGVEDIGPATFIPIAESAGLIGKLGEWVVTEACRQHQTWLKQGLKIAMAVNISPLQFRQQAFAERLRDIILDSGMDPTYLEIEVTESTLMESIDETISILRRIKSLGVKVALDDFGTGYSSLSRLSSLPLDKLKVDQSFVRGIECDHAAHAVIETIIALGRSLKLDLHGEGIESEKALHYLQEHGCNQAQGFWFSRPLPEQEFTQWCRDQSNYERLG